MIYDILVYIQYKFECTICIALDMIYILWVSNTYLFEVDGYFDIMNITIIYITTFKGAWTVSDITIGYLATKYIWNKRI